jgi:hypothetical protein
MRRIVLLREEWKPNDMTGQHRPRAAAGVAAEFGYPRPAQGDL